MAGEDFVNVQLSAAGVKMAGPGGVVSISKGRRSFTFKVGAELRVERSYEWNAVLSTEMFEGSPIFEIAPAPPIPPAPITAMQAATEHGEKQ